MPPVRQTSFSAGELAPTLWGRTDLERFATGARTMRNFFPSHHGEAVSRPGTQYVAETTQSGSFIPKLVPFVYSDEQTYVLEFSAGLIRFYTDGGVLLDLGVPYEVATPYAGGDLSRLQFAQTGDVLTIVHPSYAPRELKRLGHTSWTLSEISFSAVEPYFRDTTAPYGPTREPMVVCTTPAGAASYPAFPTTADSSHPAQEWIWKVTVVGQEEETGRIFESLPRTVTDMFDGVDPDPPGNTAIPIPSDIFALYPDMRIILRRDDTTGLLPEPTPEYKAIAFNVYRGRGNLFGFVGQTTSREFVDVGSEPDYSIQPPLGQNPFEVYDNLGALVRTEMPGTVAFFQERRVFAATEERRGYLFLSATGNYSNYDQLDLAPPGSSLVFELLTRKREDIRHVLDLGRLLVLTNSTARSVAGHQGSPLDFDSIDARVVEEIGSSYVPPLVVDDCALYVRTKGQGARALIPADTVSGFRGVDISLVSRHLFLGETRAESAVIEDGFVLLGDSKSIIDWTYQEDPWGLVWAVREDGVLLSLTFEAETKTWGWAHHDTDGLVKAICCVPEDDEDAVYLVVRRVIGGVTKDFIERMSSRVVKDSPYDGASVDCGLSYEGLPVLEITGLAHLEGESVYAVSYGNPVQGPFVVTGGAITLDEIPTAFFENPSDTEFVVVHVGLPFTCDLETLDLAQTAVRTKQKTVTSVGFEVDNSKGLYVGQDFDNLSEWDSRSVSDSYGSISAANELVVVPVEGTWDSAARACIRQTLPLPVTVLGITREVDIGG